jgi:hypothetical protein
VSYYDQLAFASFPSLYLAAPVLTDQSNTGKFTLSANTLASVGQPIIYGHDSSLMVDSTHSVTISGNPFFEQNASFELVIYLLVKDDARIAAVSTDNGNGIFLTSSSVQLQLMLENTGLLVLEIPINNWAQKLHIVTRITDTQATLTVNGVSDYMLINDVLDDTAASTVIGSGLTANQAFLFDGLGSYSFKFEDKTSVINDPGSGHQLYAAEALNGKASYFAGYLAGETIDLGLQSFSYDASENFWVYSRHIEMQAETGGYFIVETNDPRVVVEYAIDAGAVESFSGRTIIAIASKTATLSFKITDDVSSAFRLTLRPILDTQLFAHSPANMVATGTPIFMDSSESIVNTPSGVGLRDSKYAGTWFSDEAGVLPQSVEIVFKPRETGTIFTSSDGTLDTATVTGFTMWLNGVQATDLSQVRWNQWNHVVLVKNGQLAAGFTLNDGLADIDYLVLAAYPSQLVQADVDGLYRALIGVDVLSVTDQPVQIVEGAFDNAEPFQTYSFNWAIVGADGT